MVPGVAAVQGVLKVFLENELAVKRNSWKFHLRIDFLCLAIQFSIGFCFSGEIGPGEYDHLCFLGIQFDSLFGTPHCQV